MVRARGIIASSCLALSLLVSGCSLHGLLPIPGSSASPAVSPTSQPSASPTGEVVSKGLPVPDDIELPVPKRTYEAGTSPDRKPFGNYKVFPPGFSEVPGQGSLRDYFAQKLVWHPCDKGMQCASFLAPLDWHKPSRVAITIRMKRRPAAGERQGAIFINPGGPGASSQEYVDSFSRKGFENYDIVGMDSRGSGKSTPVVCGTPAQTDAWKSVDESPDNQAEVDELVAAQRQFGFECWQHSGELLKHITTIETIYDYDLARHLMGEQKLNYYGISYGTYLGVVYAELYPQNVGRMVLDAAVNISKEDDEVIQAQGFDLSLSNYAKWCAQRGCGLGNSAEAVEQRIVQFLKDLDSQPLPTKTSRMLTQSRATLGLVLYFYFGADHYQDLTDLLLYTFESKDGSAMLKAADAMNDRNEDGTWEQLAYSFPAIGCVDGNDTGVQDALKEWREVDIKKAPLLGPFFGPAVTCPVWPVKGAPSIDFTAEGAPPFLILQNTGDSATPARNAELMAGIFKQAVLVMRNAAGHGAYDEGSTCVDSKVQEFFRDGKLPDQHRVDCPS